MPLNKETKSNHTHTHIYIYIVSWSIVVEGDAKVPFSIPTILLSRRGHYSLPWIAPLTLDPYSIIPSVK